MKNKYGEIDYSEQFTNNHNTNRSNEMKPSRAEYQRKYRADNPAKFQAYHRKYNAEKYAKKKMKIIKEILHPAEAGI